MCARCKTRPARTLPEALWETLQLESRIDGNHTVDFAVGVFVVLPAIFGLRVEVDRCHGHPEVRGRGQHDLVRVRFIDEADETRDATDLPTSVSGSINLVCGYPAFLDALPDELTKVLVVGISGPIFSIETTLEFFSWGAGLYWSALVTNMAWE